MKIEMSCGVHQLTVADLHYLMLIVSLAMASLLFFSGNLR